jgi:RNAse (barnase) inhibitor barstar
VIRFVRLAPFTENDLLDAPLDFRILQDGGVALYLNPDILTDDVNWLREHNYQIHSFDCQRWVSEDAMHADWQSVLSFPGYYGRNLDALSDCLTDLSVPDDGGLALVLRSFDSYSQGSDAIPMHSGRSEARVVLDILAGTSRRFLLLGRRFLTLVQTKDPRARFEGLGGSTAQWNRREWLNKDRGL